MPKPTKSQTASVVFITSNRIGRGDDELGFALMMNFIYHLGQAHFVPDTLILMNAGVKLAAEGSESLAEMRHLEDRGTRILACGTCLEFFGVKEKLKVGAVSNMKDITNVLLSAGKVVTV